MNQPTEFPGLFAESATESVAAMIHTGDGQVLLQHREDKPGVFYPGLWGLFGGRVESGESPREALARELWEELAWHTAIPDTPYATFGWSGGGWKGSVRLRYVFEFIIDRSTVSQMQLGEGQDMGLHPITSLNGSLPVMPHDLFVLSMFTGEAYGYQADRGNV